MTDDLIGATRLVPCSVVILSTGSEGNQDAMTATAMFVAEDLPLLIISLSKESTCHELLERTGECALNVASVEQAGLAKKVGSTHGRDIDKFKTFEIEVEKGTRIGSPLIGGLQKGRQADTNGMAQRQIFLTGKGGPLVKNPGQKSGFFAVRG
jgi:flavin reductase (DIM6/NTAB) family NADH-FMN oxidoreductase RutF